MFGINIIADTKAVLLAGALASGIPVSPAEAQSVAPAGQPSVAAAPYRYQPNRFPKREGLFYGLVWGVDALSVKAVESGEIIRFSYRVVDADKARALHDKKAEPALIDQQAGVKLVVPSVDQVGMLRQSGTPVAGRSYWMAFSNSERLVKRGDRVSVVIGNFKAVGLVVE
jgi:hypothetical protein